MSWVCGMARQLTVPNHVESWPHGVNSRGNHTAYSYNTLSDI